MYHKYTTKFLHDKNLEDTHVRVKSNINGISPPVVFEQNWLSICDSIQPLKCLFITEDFFGHLGDY